jgi:hypothetical protein
MKERRKKELFYPKVNLSFHFFHFFMLIVFKTLILQGFYLLFKALEC